MMHLSASRLRRNLFWSSCSLLRRGIAQTSNLSSLSTRLILRGRINEALTELFRLHYQHHDIDLSHFDGVVFPTPKPEKFGDYQCNICMPLAKHLSVKPKDIAAQIIVLLRVDDLVTETTIAGPGFLNFWLAEAYVKDKLGRMVGDPAGRLGWAELVEITSCPQRIVVDFSSPNIAKEMHVGHLRSTIIGHTLAKVLEFAGHDVLRLNHVGDWGTQFGMLIEYVHQEHPEIIQKRRADHSSDEFSTKIGDLVTFYKKARIKFDADESFRAAARERVVQLQRGRASSRGAGSEAELDETVAMWSEICEISRREFRQIYEILGVDRLEERGESFYNYMLPGVVQLCLDLGMGSLSDGAVCIFPPGASEERRGADAPPPLMIQKSDGGFLYATTDMAALLHRVWVERADRILYVTDLSQAEHFRMVFAAARRAGVAGGVAPGGGEYSSAALRGAASTLRALCQAEDAPAQRLVQLEHVGFGLVLGEDGKKLKSRAGETVRLRALLDAAMLRTRQELQSRQKQHEGGGDRLLSQEEMSAAARAIGLGAVKYADLCMNREGNYKFSEDKMLSMSGNTAPYLLYAHARMRGIQRQAAAAALAARGGGNTAPPVAASAAEVSALLDLGTPSELQLAKHLIRFDEVLLEVERTLLPNKLCEYLYDLSIRFNAFYECCSVLHADSVAQQESRLHLCNVSADTLKLGLDLLGLDTVERL